MGSDIVVALNKASAHRTTVFGLNHYAANTRQSVQVVHGQMHDPGDFAHTASLRLPQARQTFSVLGIQTIGQWGFTHGVNEQQVAIGITDWRSRLIGPTLALAGPDLVRLALERGRTAHHAVEVLTDLLEHHSQSATHGNADHIFLIADANEAFVLETCGRFWALLECGHTRVVTDVGMIRQDWRRLSPGLASFVIDQGWASDDGSKIDFVRCLGEPAGQTKNAQKRWGRASLALAQQQGAIDLHYVRRMLADHYQDNCDFLPGPNLALVSSFFVDLPKSEEPLVAWLAFGTPNVALHFPLCLIGELPAAFGEGTPAEPSIQQRVLELHKLSQGKDCAKLAPMLERLQTKFDQDVEDFLLKAHDYREHGKPYLVNQIATEMMHHHVELFDAEYRRLFGLEVRTPSGPVAAEEEVLFFA
jgi:hypothetical protein